MAVGYGFVTPLAGVWVEIEQLMTSANFAHVTPLAGVWVEIYQQYDSSGEPSVTPLAGVWVEISWISVYRPEITSLPLRECGLKYWVL